MSSRMSGSEEALATLACDRVGADARVLVGGYGMGFTLRTLLARLGPKAQVTVAELVPAVIAWARGPMADFAAGCLDDARVAVVEDDVGAVMRGGRGTFDAILLDVDNGPDGLTRKGNNGLYTMTGLTAARDALSPGGVLAVWSAGPDPAFTRRLEKNGFDVEVIRVAARSNGKGPKHTIWFATAS